MKKKMIILILIVFITLTIITILVIKNITGRITGIIWYKLIDFEIDDEEKVQIIDYPDTNMSDASSITYYNFEFNKKNVSVLYRSDSYLNNPKSHYYKYKYELTDEEITYIKDKIDKINNEEINNEEINNQEINNQEINDEEINNVNIGAGIVLPKVDKEYGVITIQGKKVFSGNDEVENLIEDIISIISRKDIY